MERAKRFSALLAPAALLCACATGSTSYDSGPSGTPDAPIGQPDASIPHPDAAPGTPDAAPGTPDAYVPPTPDASVPHPDAASSGTPITITQSLSQTILSTNSVSCNSETSGHSDNSYFRVFTLTDEGIDSQFDVTSVEVGIEDAVSGTGGQQPAFVYLYTLSGAPLTANLTEIGSASVSVSDQSLSTIDVNVTGTVPAGGTLAVEFYTPNGQDDGHFLFVGSNDDGETGPTYMVAADCGVADMTTTTDIGFPEMQWVLNVTGIYYP